MTKLLTYNGKLTDFYNQGITRIYHKGIHVKNELNVPIEVSIHDATYTIESGFVWDGSSMPKGKIIQINSPFNFLLAGLVHDYLYTKQHETRKEADKIYRETMIYEGASKWRAYGRYYVLRAFGWVAWNKAKKENNI